jgi:phage gpG-like protein
MINVTIKVKGLSEARDYIQQLPERIHQLKSDQTVLKEIGTQLRGSAIRNINMSGFGYFPYKPLAESTLRERARKKQGSKPLVREGTLRLSLDYEVSGGELFLNSVDYLKYHQFTEDRVKAKFPARPVWGVHQEDMEEIADILMSRLQP